MRIGGGESNTSPQQPAKPIAFCEAEADLAQDGAADAVPRLELVNAVAYYGAMANPQYREALVEYIRAQAQPPDKFSHQARLYALALVLAENRPYDDDVLFAAAWIHDLGVFIGHRPENPADLAAWDHIAYVNRKAPALLAGLGFPPAKIAAVLEAVRTHLPTAEPTTFEGMLLRDADLLEQLGATGILRIVSKVGRDTRFPRFSDALGVLQRNLEDLPLRLKLDSARRLAAPRMEVLGRFLEAAGGETGSIPW